MNYNSYFQRRKARRRRKKGIRILLFIFILLIFFSFLYKFIYSNNIPLWKENVLSEQTNELKQTIENSLNGSKGTYAVAIKNLKTEESYYLNEHRIFEAGSLYKLWVMATVFKQVQEGNLTEDDVLNADITDLNTEFSIASDSAELTSGNISLTVASALKQMITISHNYAALLLTEKIKLSSVAMFLKDNGFNDSSVGTNGNPPKTTAEDILLFYEKLYKQKLGTKESTDRMIDLLKNQKLNDGLPKYLPEQSQVAHKTGDIGWFKHDAGIVFSVKGDYIMVVLSESNSPASAQERIAALSKSAYVYFNK